VKIIRTNVSRCEVIEAYAAYDRAKKHLPDISDFACWEWQDASEIDLRLANANLKHGVLSAYKLWWFVELSASDLLSCAIVNHIFADQSQVVSAIVLSGLLPGWSPPDPHPDWYATLEEGGELGPGAPLILRPALRAERPATWYIEDGSGRALCLVRRILRFAEFWRVAYAYVGIVPDHDSPFVSSHRELTAG